MIMKFFAIGFIFKWLPKNLLKQCFLGLIIFFNVAVYAHSPFTINVKSIVKNFYVTDEAAARSQCLAFFVSCSFSVKLVNGNTVFLASGYTHLPRSNEAVTDHLNHYYWAHSSPVKLSANLVNSGNTHNNTCHPINIATGNKYFVRNNYTGQGLNPLAVNFYYNSAALSQVWSHDYSQFLIVDGENITVNRPDGKEIMFSVVNGNIISPPQRVERLTLNGNVYQLMLADNTRETYNSNGSLLSIEFTSGITHELEYTNNTVTVKRNDESLIFTFNDGALSQLALPDGGVISYTSTIVDGYYVLEKITYEDNSEIIYLYEEPLYPHYITGVLDENNHRISSVEYDSQGRTISSEVGTQNSGINRTQIQYHADGTRTVTNSLGKQNTYHFTQFNGEYKMTQVEGHASANCAAANQNYTYDANGFMASKTDWEGNVTTYVHNSRGLEASRTEASGTPQARTITTEWHPTFNLKTKITEPERETVFTYNTNGQLISQEVTPR